MDECALIFLAVAAAGTILAGSIAGIVALVKISRLNKDVASLAFRLESLKRKAEGGTEIAPAPVDARVPVAMPVKPDHGRPGHTSDLSAAQKDGALGHVRDGIIPAEGGEATLTEDSGRGRPDHISESLNGMKIPARAAKSMSWDDLEARIGKRWMTWAGAIVLFLSAAFFVKYAFDNNWLGPASRVALGVAFGVAMLLAGERGIRRDMGALGQGLVGAGLAVVFVSLFAGYSLYHLMSNITAFAAMVLVVGAGMALAVLHAAPAMAILAAIGGYLTPVLLSQGVDARDALFGYLAALNLGVLLVATFRNWRALDLLAFVATFALYTGWFDAYYDKPALVPALIWLFVFFTQFQIVPFARHWREKSPITLERFALALADATITFAFAVVMLREDHPHALGFVALGFGALYTLLGAWTRRRLPDESRALFGFVALAVAFVTIAVPLHLEIPGTAILWAIEGPILLYLGYRFRYAPLRHGAAAVAALAVIYTLGEHTPLHHAPFVPITNIPFATASGMLAALIVFARVHRAFESAATAWDGYLRQAALVAASLAAAYFASGEAGEYLTFIAPERVWELSGAWSLRLPTCAAAAALALTAAMTGFLARRAKSRALVACAALVAGVAALLAMSAYEHAGSGWAWFANWRFGTALSAAAAGSFIAARRIESTRGTFDPRPIGFGAVTLFALAILTLENYSFFSMRRIDAQGEWGAQMAVTITWGLFAVAALVVGFRIRVRAVRLAALGLLGVAGLKLVLFDMSSVEQIYRILTFVAMGLLMIGASYLYHVVEKRVAADAATSERA